MNCYINCNSENELSKIQVNVVQKFSILKQKSHVLKCYVIDDFHTEIDYNTYENTTYSGTRNNFCNTDSPWISCYQLFDKEYCRTINTYFLPSEEENIQFIIDRVSGNIMQTQIVVYSENADEIIQWVTNFLENSRRQPQAHSNSVVLQ